MIPAEIKVNIYRNSTNSFLVEYVDDENNPFDVTGFEKIEAVLFLGSRFNTVETLPMSVSETNIITATLTPQQTEQFFFATNYRIEVRFYTDQTNWLPYTIVVPNLLDAYRPDGNIEKTKVQVVEEGIKTVVLSETSAYAAIALQAKNDSITAKEDSESARDESVSAKDDSESARDIAVSARDDTETARDIAVDAKNDAETAKTEIETSAEKIEDSYSLAIQAFDTAALLKLITKE